MSDSKIIKTVYFVRHGQSEHNVAPIFQAPDSKLSNIGIEQASYIAERVSKLSFDVLISSPFERAKQTAEEISKKTGKIPEYCDLFIERVKPSNIYNKPYSDEKANNLWREWDKSLYTPGLKIEDGENYEDLVNRADKALDFFNSRKEQSFVVVTHGFFLRMIIFRVLIGNFGNGNIFQHFQKASAMENTGLTVLRYQAGFEEQPRWRLWIHNDHAHLG